MRPPGGIGQILVQWAKAMGCEVFDTSSTPDKQRLVKSLGADHVIDYAHQDFAAVVQDLTGKRGVDVVFDSAGTTTFAGSLAALGLRGNLISFGQTSGPVGSWEIDRFASKSLTISRPNYAHYTDTPQKPGPHVGRFFAAVRSGTVRLQAPTVYPLAQAAQAHHDLETRATTDALMLLP